MQNHTRGIIYASITALCWGFLAVGLKVADQVVDPLTIVWIRFVFAFILLAGWQVGKKPSSFQLMLKPPLLLIVAAIGLSWNYISYMLGIHFTTPSNAQLFIQLGPILLAAAGFLFFREKIQKKQIVGFGITFVGMAFYYRDQLSAFFDNQKNYNLGILILISSAIAWAVYAILQKRLLDRYPVDSLNLFLFGLPTLIYLPLADPASLFQLHWLWWLLLFFLGANTFISYTFLAMALKCTEASKVSIIIIMNPIITFVTMGILTWMNVSWIAHERFTAMTILGASLVITGAILVVRKTKQKPDS